MKAGGLNRRRSVVVVVARMAGVSREKQALQPRGGTTLAPTRELQRSVQGYIKRAVAVAGTGAGYLQTSRASRSTLASTTGSFTLPAAKASKD